MEVGFEVDDPTLSTLGIDELKRINTHHRHGKWGGGLHRMLFGKIN